MPRNNAPLPLAPVTLIRHTAVLSCQAGAVQMNFDYVGDGMSASPYADLQNFGTVWAGLNLANLVAALAADTKVQSFTSQMLNINTIPSAEYIPVGAPIAGSIAGTSLDSVQAVVVSRYTNTKGQHGRGRTYFGPISSTFVTPATSPNQLNAAGAVVLKTLFDAIQGGLVTVGGVNYAWGVFQRPVQPANEVSRAQAASSYVIRTTFGTARRRRLGRGI